MTREDMCVVIGMLLDIERGVRRQDCYLDSCGIEIDNDDFNSIPSISDLILNLVGMPPDNYEYKDKDDANSPTRGYCRDGESQFVCPYGEELPTPEEILTELEDSKAEAWKIHDNREWHYR